ncbi:PREDICTED: E3 ubiquitin-protein ligase RFWD3-like isoform X2 [Camelina sativa]|uniref:RING-type E3 ubiquitin transferase n=1 Tax=Camelina sativa TaxID=90675 RepID=A0ABM0XTH9_CAMSA|nr:PREDICTED: E3 ubiquitin-protein ligase RFWD3-like isoform X2 [Camelina sativa]
MPRRRRNSGPGVRIAQYIESEDEGEDYEEEEEVVGEEEDEQSEDEEEEEEDTESQTRDVVVSPRVSQKESQENQKMSQGICSSSGSQEDEEWKHGETEGLFCLICMEVWTNDGEHQVCCLPCGHLYGFSCIKKWLQQRQSAGKCPQCIRKCSLRDVRKIYASRVAAVDDEAQKRILFLESKLSSIEQKTASWSNKEAQWKKMEAELRLEVHKLKKIADMESLAMGAQRNSHVASQNQYIPGHTNYQEHHGHAPSCSFRHQGDLLVSGGRLFDIDGGRKIVLLARRLSGVGGTFVLTQMSLHSGEIDDILLPPTTRAIKDLHLSPHNNGLAVFGSLGKKLSVISLESHNTVLSYDLPAAPWSCSWDLNSSHYIYAGLQNGMVLVFDRRQTTGPFASLTGLTTNPVHTIHHLSTNSTPTSDVRPLLSASSIGLCQWNIYGSEGSPSLISETGNTGVCISSSYCPRSDHIVASYRPRVGSSEDTVQTQPSLTQTGVNNSNSNGVDGFHVSLKRRGADSYYQKLSSTQAFVDNIRLPRTAIIDFGEGKNQQLFASCDESTRELILQDPLNFAVSQRFPLSSHLPLQDVKYAHVNGTGLLGLLNDEKLQLFRNESP